VLHAVRAEASGHRVEDEGRAIALDAPVELAPGSYVLVATAANHPPTRYPVLLERAQDTRVEVPLREAHDVPPGFVFVPPGDTLLGSADEEGVRAALGAAPEHAVHVDAFLIGEREVTYAEYVDFLASLPAAEIVAHRPHADDLELTYDAGGVPLLSDGVARARRGDALCRPKRSERRCQDWLRMPVAGIAWEDAQAYVAWLARGPLAGARLCSEREWERAARGADARLYGHGDALRPGDADFDATYALDVEAMGADEVGSFPADRSPFGVLDLAGNVAEWVAGRVARGGAWGSNWFNARAAARALSNGDRARGIGVRVCMSIR
jgi:formylglycine-generating enzyme required for sulfatase activity